VLLSAVLELVPPLLVRQIVDEHLARGRSEGLLWIAALYLGATAAVQAMGFLTECLTAVIARGALRVFAAARWHWVVLILMGMTPVGNGMRRDARDMIPAGGEMYERARRTSPAHARRP
jgi:hypothetical protein